MWTSKRSWTIMKFIMMIYFDHQNLDYPSTSMMLANISAVQATKNHQQLLNNGCGFPHHSQQFRNLLVSLFVVREQHLLPHRWESDFARHHRPQVTKGPLRLQIPWKQPFLGYRFESQKSLHPKLTVAKWYKRCHFGMGSLIQQQSQVKFNNRDSGFPKNISYVIDHGSHPFSLNRSYSLKVARAWKRCFHVRFISSATFQVSAVGLCFYSWMSIGMDSSLPGKESWMKPHGTISSRCFLVLFSPWSITITSPLVYRGLSSKQL